MNKSAYRELAIARLKKAGQILAKKGWGEGSSIIFLLAEAREELGDPRGFQQARDAILKVVGLKDTNELLAWEEHRDRSKREIARVLKEAQSVIAAG